MQHRITNSQLKNPSNKCLDQLDVLLNFSVQLRYLNFFKKYCLHISYFISGPDEFLQEGVRSPFPIPIRPGSELTIPVRIEAPNAIGNYQIKVFLVQEFVGWCQDDPQQTLAGRKTFKLRILTGLQKHGPLLNA